MGRCSAIEMRQAGCTVMGPMLVGLNGPVLIVGLSAEDSDIVAAIAADSVRQ